MRIYNDKYTRRERAGWEKYNIYCPKECCIAIKAFYRQWKIANIKRWFDDEIINRPEGPEGKE